MTRTDESFKDFILDQLANLPAVVARRMFGGFGLYQDETFFAIILKGKLFFKVDECSVSEYRKYKMTPFRPTVRHMLKSYYQVPVEIIEDADALCEWAVNAARCQGKNRQA